MDNCYCVCHSPISSCPACVHCYPNIPRSLTIVLNIRFLPDGTRMCIAHCLDLDLVTAQTVAHGTLFETETETLEKLYLSIKNYLEYGIEKGTADDSIFPAPIHFWEELNDMVSLGEILPIKTNVGFIKVHTYLRFKKNT